MVESIFSVFWKSQDLFDDHHSGIHVGLCREIPEMDHERSTGFFPSTESHCRANRESLVSVERTARGSFQSSKPHEDRGSWSNGSEKGPLDKQIVVWDRRSGRMIDVVNGVNLDRKTGN